MVRGAFGAVVDDASGDDAEEDDEGVPEEDGVDICATRLRRSSPTVPGDAELIACYALESGRWLKHWVAEGGALRSQAILVTFYGSFTCRVCSQ